MLTLPEFELAKKWLLEGATSVADELAKLAALRSSDMLTVQEFEGAKKVLLEGAI